MEWIVIYQMAIGLFWVALACYLIVNRAKVSYLRNVKLALSEHPSVVIVIAVRNEEATIEEALRSVCKLDYPRYRVLVINDRSTDNTPVILRTIAKEFPVLSILNIQSLPDGWMGKNHALYQGFLSSTEEWLLFTDADVIFERDTLSKAIAYATRYRLGHLTILPQVKSRSGLLNAVLGTFVLMLELRQRPWAVRNAKSNASLGVGAFNLVSRDSYIKAGTHRAISMRPDDDLKLAEKIKCTGSRTDAVYGENQIRLEWYSSVQEFIRGLMKNTFSIFNYRWWFMFRAGMVPTFIFFVSPILFVFGGAVGWMVLAVILLAQAIIFGTNRGVKSYWWHFITIPFTGLLMLYILLRSAVATLWQGGIYWRESFYPLDQLRKGK